MSQEQPAGDSLDNILRTLIDSCEQHATTIMLLTKTLTKALERIAKLEADVKDLQEYKRERLRVHGQ